jgi:hypothetical protein
MNSRLFGIWYRSFVVASLVLFWAVLVLYSFSAQRHESHSMSAADLLARMGSQAGYQTCKTNASCTGANVSCPPDKDCATLGAVCTPNGMGTPQAIEWQSPQFCANPGDGFRSCSLTPNVSTLCDYRWDCICKRDPTTMKLYCSQTTLTRDCFTTRPAIGCTYMTCP